MKKQEMQPTLKDVATTSGVSIATVSRIVNNVTDGYSVETKERVLRAVEELGYSPNIAARSMKTGQASSIGVLVPDLISMFSSSILKGIEAKASEFGLNVIITNTEANGWRTLEYLRTLHEKRVDGILFLSEYFKPEYADFIRKRDIPLVLISTQADYEAIPFVKVDDRLATKDGVKALIGLGHRKIAYIAGSMEDKIAGIPRVEGYRTALVEAGLPVDESLILSANGFRFEDVAKITAALDEVLPRVSAIACASDELAVGVMKYAIASGYSIPGDISVLGFDDLPLALMVSPALSSVRQPLQDMGRFACERLVALRMGQGQRDGLIVPHRIVLRDSTGPCRP